jgi:hypothetical protein
MVTLYKYLCFAFLCFYSYTTIAQNRNETVRSINNAISIVNSFKYLDIYICKNAERLAEEVFKHSGNISQSNFVMLEAFETSTQIATRKLLRTQLKQGKFIQHKPVQEALLKITQIQDSLLAVYYNMLVYASKKLYATDTNANKANSFLQAIEELSERHALHAKNLENVTRSYITKYPPLTFHKNIIAAKVEMEKVIDVFEQWKLQLQQNNNTQNNNFVQQIYELQKQSAPKDSFYLKKTYGFGYLSIGCFAHSRYWHFYVNVSPQTFHNNVNDVTNKYYIPFLDTFTLNYNRFAQTYNQTIEGYNQFVTTTDSKTMSEETDYFRPPYVIKEKDHVLLHKPTVPLLFKRKQSNPDYIKNITPIIDTLRNDSAYIKIQKALPHHIVYLIDASNSMNEYENFAAVQKHIIHLVQRQRNNDFISLILFADSATTLLTNITCDNKQLIADKIYSIKAAGGTNFDAGIEIAVQKATTHFLPNGKNKILIFTDGLFEAGKEAIKQLQALQNKQISLALIYLGINEDNSIEKAFKKISKKTKATFYNIGAKDLPEVLLKEATE